MNNELAYGLTASPTNDYVRWPVKIMKIPVPSNKILVADGYYQSGDYDNFYTTLAFFGSASQNVLIVWCHYGANFTFLDGHLEAQRLSSRVPYGATGSWRAAYIGLYKD